MKCSSRDLILILTALLLTGCSGLLESDLPARQTWWLEPLEGVSANRSPSARALSISVESVPGLDTDRLLTLDPNAKLNHFAGAHWADNLTRMLTSLFQRSLNRASSFQPVNVGDIKPAGGCHLDLLIQKFYSTLDENERARSVEISVSGWLDCGDDGGTIVSEASIPVSGNRMPEVVAAFQRGLDQVSRDIIKQLDP